MTSGAKYDVALTVDAGLEWLRERDPDRPFFLFLHTKSVHTAPAGKYPKTESDAPYRSPEAFESRYLPEGRLRFPWRDGEKTKGVRYLRKLNKRLASGEIEVDSIGKEKLAELIALYDGGIRYVDEQFGRLDAALRELDLSDDTVVIVTADHGEAFLEHYFFLHKEVFSTQTWIPLMILDPGVAQSSVESAPATLMDVAATILARAGLPLPERGQGRSLIRDRESDPPVRQLFLYAKINREQLYEAYALDDGRHRLIYHKHRSWAQFRVDLFDRQADPKEIYPINGEVELKRTMMARLMDRIRMGESDAGPRIDLDPQTLESLRALGYVD
jgi:arylsulfatase A-like enzyme